MASITVTLQEASQMKISLFVCMLMFHEFIVQIVKQFTHNKRIFP